MASDDEAISVSMNQALNSGFYANAPKQVIFFNKLVIDEASYVEHNQSCKSVNYGNVNLMGKACQIGHFFTGTGNGQQREKNG